MRCTGFKECLLVLWQRLQRRFSHRIWLYDSLKYWITPRLINNIDISFNLTTGKPICKVESTGDFCVHTASYWHACICYSVYCPPDWPNLFFVLLQMPNNLNPVKLKMSTILQANAVFYLLPFCVNHEEVIALKESLNNLLIGSYWYGSYNSFSVLHALGANEQEKECKIMRSWKLN